MPRASSNSIAIEGNFRAAVSFKYRADAIRAPDACTGTHRCGTITQSNGENEMKRKLLGILVAGAMAAGSLALAPAYATSGHAHGHADTAQMLVLNNGQKWESDEPLRDSMTKIRDAIDAKLAEIRKAGQPAQYDALGGEINVQVANIVQNCKLEPAADEVLHAILAEMIDGNEALQGKDPEVTRMQGVERVVHSLGLYAKYFQHPGFEAPHATH